MASALSTPDRTEMDLLGLDRESILLILSFLDQASLCSLQLVCKELCVLCESNLIWLALMAERFGLKLQVGNGDGLPKQ